MLIGLLGILKAGGAYLPLDPHYPRERLAFMLADAGAPVLVTQAALLDTFPDTPAQVVRLDADADSIARQPATAPVLGLDPERAGQHAAYVIYTSGSTGRPKGVVVTHAALGNFLGAMAEQVPLTADDRLLAVTTIGFDIAALELYLPLLHGAAVVIAPRATVQDAEAAGQGDRRQRRHRDAGDADLVADAARRWRRRRRRSEEPHDPDRWRAAAG